MEQTGLSRTLSLFAVVSWGLTIGCASPSDEPGPEASAHGECGGNGEMHESHGHCHCDEGYDLSADGMDCVASPDADPAATDDDSNDDTGSSASNFDPGSVEGVLYRGADPYHVLTAKEGRTWLSIENYPSLGGASGPDSRAINATEANYATCGVCIMLQTGCQAHGDHAHCDATFMPEVGGSIEFDALGSEMGDSWSGVLGDVRFVEVTINPRSYETTPVADGDVFELGTWAFDVVLEAN